MLSISRMLSHRVFYYVSTISALIGVVGYYTPPNGHSQWIGRGAAALGLAGTVTTTVLENLLRGYSPDGSRALVQNADSPDRHLGLDLTFSAPKPVSLLMALGDLNVRDAVLRSHDAAVRAALQFLEDNIAVGRRGKDGVNLINVDIVAAAIRELESREHDPQLHTHVLIQNIGVTPGTTKTGALDTRPFYAAKMAAGAIYRSELAHQLRQELGVGIVREKSWFSIVGIPEPIQDKFSKRREQIENALNSHGTSSARASAVATLATRDAKQVLSHDQLFNLWQQTAASVGLDKEKIRQLTNRPQPTTPLEDRQAFAIKEAIQKLTAQQSHFVEIDLMRFTAEAGQGLNLSATQVRQAVGVALAHSPDIVRLGPSNRGTAYTTKEILAIERDMIEKAVAGRHSQRHSIRAEVVEQGLLQWPTLKEEQKNVLRHITIRHGDVQQVEGKAGTGKTFVLKIANEVWKSEGLRPVGMALAGKAAQGLQDASGIPSDTIHRSLIRIGASNSHAKGKQRKIESLVIDEKSVVVVDEAGMCGTRLLAQIVDICRERQAKLVLVGDSKQLQAVDLGGAFYGLGQRLGAAQLTEITRQKDPWARIAVEAFSEGRAAEGLGEYVSRGLVAVTKDRDAAMKKLISNWSQEGIKEPAKNLILAPIHLEVAALNEEAQRVRGESGELGRKFTRAGEVKIHENDRILFTKNSRQLGVRNGHLATVESIAVLTKMVTARLDSGEKVVIPLNDYSHVKLGYCISVHAAQGVTVENAYILLGGSLQDRELSYVEASRARGVTNFYVDQFEAGPRLADLAKQMSHSRQKLLAHDVGNGPDRDRGLSPEYQP